MSKKKAKAKKKINVIEITHECGHVIGSIAPTDDGGNTQIICPKCKKILVLSHEALMQFFYNHFFGEDNLNDKQPKPTDYQYKVMEVELK